VSKIIALVLVTLLSVSVMVDCRAQENAEELELMTVDGKVTGVDVSRSTITIKAANELTFSVPAKTAIMEGIYDIKLSDIEADDYVTIEHYKDPSGMLIATKITVENKEM